MRALPLSCVLVCAVLAGCGRERPRSRAGPRITAKPPVATLNDPNITVDQVEAIIVRESRYIPMEYLTVFENRILSEGLWIPQQAGANPPANRAKLLASYWSAIREMPREGTGEKEVMEAPSYFPGDIIDIWMVFREHSRGMRREGLGVDPDQLIACANDVMRKSGVKPPGNERAGEFCSLYRHFRLEEQLTHGQAVAELVKSRKFGPGPR